MIFPTFAGVTVTVALPDTPRTVASMIVVPGATPWIVPGPQNPTTFQSLDVHIGSSVVTCPIASRTMT